MFCNKFEKDSHYNCSPSKKKYEKSLCTNFILILLVFMFQLLKNLYQYRLLYDFSCSVPSNQWILIFTNYCINHPFLVHV